MYCNHCKRITDFICRSDDASCNNCGKNFRLNYSNKVYSSEIDLESSVFSWKHKYIFQNGLWMENLLSDSYTDISNVSPYADPIKISENLESHVYSLRKSLHSTDVIWDKKENLFRLLEEIVRHIDHSLRNRKLDGEADLYILMNEKIFDQIIDSIEFINDEFKKLLKENKQLSLNGMKHNINLFDYLNAIFIIAGKKNTEYNLFNVNNNPLFYTARIQLGEEDGM